MKKHIPVILLAGVILLSGCTSSETYALNRRNQMLSLYPPGTTTRSDVLLKWNNTRAELTEFRPSAGWEKAHDPLVARRAADAERRTGKRVVRCERYRSPEGLTGYAFSWFFYDSADKVVDVFGERVP